MNRNLLLAGGLVLVAGGLTYWYLSQENGWVPPPPPPDGCQGNCYFEGITDCDNYDNLCKCINGEWILFEENSPKCTSGLKHNECFPSIPSNITTCIPIPGVGTDLCDTLGFSKGCPCINTDCDVYHFCDERVYRCIQTASNLPINADNSNWDLCEYSPDPPWNSSGHQCFFTLDDEYAGSTLIGTFSWEWGFFSSKGTLNIYGYLDGVGWTLLGTHNWDMWGTEGTEQIILNIPTQGMSQLLFQCYGTAWTNVKPKSFYGHLSI